VLFFPHFPFYDFNPLFLLLFLPPGMHLLLRAGLTSSLDFFYRLGACFLLFLLRIASPFVVVILQLARMAPSFCSVCSRGFLVFFRVECPRYFFLYLCLPVPFSDSLFELIFLFFFPGPISPDENTFYKHWDFSFSSLR